MALILFSASYWVRWRKKTAQPPPPDFKLGNPEGFLLLAADALWTKQIDHARDPAQQGLKLNPKDQRIRASLLNIIGNTLASAGTQDKASEHFRSAIKTDPTFAFPHGNLGNLLFLNKDFFSG